MEIARTHMARMIISLFHLQCVLFQLRTFTRSLSLTHNESMILSEKESNPIEWHTTLDARN